MYENIDLKRAGFYHGARWTVDRLFNFSRGHGVVGWANFVYAVTPAFPVF